MQKNYTVFGWFILFLFPFISLAQVTVKWQKWPAVLQLYPRNDLNEAEVAIAGQLQSTQYAQVSLIIHRNGQRWKYLRAAVTKSSTQARFELTPTIKAGLYQYKFSVYAINGQDSTLVGTRDNIVCGDVILFNGQSNINRSNFANYSYQNNFVRTFGDHSTATPDTLWRLSNANLNRVGVIATELQRFILETYQMPTCVINGASGGSPLRDHLYRNAANPADPQSLYGRLLYWAQKAGVIGRVRAFVWRQGENEAGGGDAGGYEQNFQALFNNWQIDYPNVGKFYVAQNNLLPDNNKGAAQLRDFQRRTPLLFPKTVGIATVGLPAYDGVHYGLPGETQFALEIFRLIARDVYQSTDVNGIASPAIRKAYYKTAEKKEVVLEFEPGATMVWKQDTIVDGTTMDIRDFIYFDYAHVQQERVIASGSAEGNRIILKLSKPISATTITYLPNSYKTPFGGPFLKNSRGMRAFTFHKVTIENASSEPPSTNPPVDNPPVDNPPTTNPPVVNPPTTPPSTNPPGANYGGSLDGAGCDNIWGWVYNKDYPNAPITVEFLANNVVVGSIQAANFRQDLKNAGKGNGEHGFNFAPPVSIKNGQAQAIKARVVGTTYFLPGGSKNITCANTGTSTPPVDNPPTTNPPTTNPPTTNPPTTPPSTNPPGANYGGSLDGAACDNIWGWVYNKDYPNAPITVEFLANNVVVGSIQAANFRQDLKNAGKGNGEHGFNFAPPVSIKNGQVQAIKARVVGTTYFLPGGSKNITCANTGTSTPPVDNPPTTNPPTTNPPTTNPPTTPPSTNPPGANYGGSLDGAACDNIWGWVYNKDYPNAPITVEFLANNVVVGSIQAANFRQDLKNAGKGNGEHGFNFAPPVSIKNGQVQAIKARVVGTTYFLPGGSKNVTCANAARMNAETTDVALTVSVYPNPTSGRLTIRVFIPEQQLAVFSVSDIAGRPLWQRTITGAGTTHQEVVDLPTTVAQSVLVSAQLGDKKVVRTVLINR